LKMSLPIPKHKKKSGQWFHNPEDGKYYYKEFIDTFGSRFKLYLPEEIEGVSRSCAFDLAFAKDVADDSSFNGKKKLWFKQTVTLRIRDDVSQNIWLFWNDTNFKWYLRDLSEFGMTMECPLQNSEIIQCDKTEPTKCDLQFVRQLKKVSGYIYSMVSTNPQGEIQEYIVSA
jgi:hypothetical protein